jgi:heat shock protein HtpX
VNRTTWLAQRAALAVALMIGFYVMGTAIALGLLAAIYAQIALAHRVYPQILLACLVGALTIFWALLPRRDRFEAPGPRLDERNAPGLLAVVREVAETTGQEMPADAYLLNDANAFVTYRGGVMGIGSRRVLGIGLPLFHALSVPQLTGVIAHEFGHYAAGDVGLGPWIYKTRAAIGRTLDGLKGSWIAAPFRAYARMFLTLTQAVSREQEFQADALAARLVGPGALVTGLYRVAPLGPLFSAYLEQEVLPVMRAGFLPPIATGFGQFVAADEVQASAIREAQRTLEQEEAGEFDSHPPLRKRLEALERIGAPGKDEAEGERASTLLRDPDALARELAVRVFGAEAVARLTPVAWEGVTRQVHMPAWRSTVESEAAWLSGLTADTLPSGADALLDRLPGWTLENGTAMGEEERLGRAAFAMGAAVGVALMGAGWQPETAPGQRITFVRDGDRFDPHDAVAGIITETSAAKDWAEACQYAGIAGVPLAKAAAATPAGGDAVPNPARPLAPAPFPAFNRSMSDPLHALDQLATHPERWATAPVDDLGQLLAFHSMSLIQNGWADAFGLPLSRLHDVFAARASAAERLKALQSIAELADRLARDTDHKDAGSVIQRFLFDPDLLIASTAALNIAVLYAPGEDDPLSGVKLIAGMASKGLNHRRRAAWLAGLVAIGDGRAVDLIDGCWGSLSAPAQNVLVHQGLGQVPTPAMAEFYLRWAEAAVGDGGGEHGLGHALAGVINVATRAGLPDAAGREIGVVEVDRAIPAWTKPAESALRVTGRWSKAEFAKVIEHRLRAIAALEQEPRIAGRALEAWDLPADA